MTAMDILISRGVRPSLHRMKILEYLMSRKNHPTAEKIYSDISGDIPTLSKATVYNTLKTFLEKGVARAITIDDHEQRYDYETALHGHFMCRKCGKIFDVKINPAILDFTTIEGHAITEKHLYFKGMCKHCKKGG